MLQALTLNQTCASMDYFQHIPVYQRFQWINNPLVRNIIRKFLAPNKKGRKGYDKVLMFCWLMYRQFMRCTYRDLESMTGIDYSTFIKFRKRLVQKRWFPRVFKKVSTLIAENLTSLLFILDSSFVETYSKHDEEGSEYSGYKQKNGFKLHQMIEYDTRLPIMQRATGGARHDIVSGHSLIRASPKSWKVRAVLADKGYDSSQFAHDIKMHWRGAKVVIPLRRMKPDESPSWIKLKAKGRTLDPALYKKRTEIERYFSRKKMVFHLGEERTRHLKNFRTNCYMTSLMEILEWSTTPQEMYYSPGSYALNLTQRMHSPHSK